MLLTQCPLYPQFKEVQKQVKDEINFESDIVILTEHSGESRYGSMENIALLVYVPFLPSYNGAEWEHEWVYFKRPHKEETKKRWDTLYSVSPTRKRFENISIEELSSRVQENFEYPEIKRKKKKIYSFSSDARWDWECYCSNLAVGSLA